MNYVRTALLFLLAGGVAAQMACRGSVCRSGAGAVGLQPSCRVEVQFVTEDALVGPLVLVAETDAGRPQDADVWVIAQVFILNPSIQAAPVELAPCRRVRQWHAYGPGRPRWSSSRDPAWTSVLRIKLPKASGDSPYLVHEISTAPRSQLLIERGRSADRYSAVFRNEWLGGNSISGVSFLASDQGGGALLFVGGPIELGPNSTPAEVSLKVGPWYPGGNIEAIGRIPDALGKFEHRRLGAYRVTAGGQIELLWLVRKFGAPATWPLDSLAPSVGFATDTYVRIRDLR